MPLEVSVGFAKVEELTAVLMKLLFFWYIKLFRVLTGAENGYSIVLRNIGKSTRLYGGTSQQNWDLFRRHSRQVRRSKQYLSSLSYVKFHPITCPAGTENE